MDGPGEREECGPGECETAEEWAEDARDDDSIERKQAAEAE